MLKTDHIRVQANDQRFIVVSGLRVSLEQVQVGRWMAYALIGARGQSNLCVETSLVRQRITQNRGVLE